MIRMDGKVQQIKNVRIKTPAGESRIGKAISLLNCYWVVQVDFEPISSSIAEVKNILCDYITSDYKMVEPFFQLKESIDKTIDFIQCSNDIAAIFSCFYYGEEFQALDAL